MRIDNKTFDDEQGRHSAGIVLGARVPIFLTSRADSAEARPASCAVATAYARFLRENRKAA